MLRAAPHVVFKRVGDELVLLDYHQGLYYGLDPIGSRMWDLVVEGRDVEAIVTTLIREYETTEATLRHDVAELVDELMTLGLLESE